MNNYRTILMNLMKSGPVRLGAWIFVGQASTRSPFLGAGLLCNLEIYKKLFDNAFMLSS